MSVLLSIICLLCDGTLIIESAPKLGDIFSDPLSNEAKLSGTEIKNIILNLMNNSFHASTEEHKDLLIPPKLDLRKSEHTESTQRPSCGYDYNETICKTVDDRVICGYDKNVGEVDNKIIDVGNGCRIRGDRLECGYLTGPFNYIRRPPANDADEQKIENSSQKLDKSSKELENKKTLRSNLDTPSLASVIMFPSTTRKKSTIYSTMDIKASTSFVKNITTSLLSKTGLTSSSSTLTTSKINIIKGTKADVTKKTKQHCVETNHHIFCYNIRP